MTSMVQNMKTWTGFDPHSVRSVSAKGINVCMKDPAFELACENALNYSD